MAELTAVVSSLRDVAEGPDCLHNNMIKHLPEVALQVLLSILNRLWGKGRVPARLARGHSHSNFKAWKIRP